MVNDADALVIASIKANAHSLLEQLKEYDFLTITDEQSRKLATIENMFHYLVEDITNKTE